MNFHYAKYSKLAITIGVATAVVATGANVLAWGPDRPTYTIEKPSDHVTFNSITNNPAYGDERNFLRVKEASAPNSEYSDTTKVIPGKEYEAYIYFHNNASATFNDAAHNYSGIANNTKMRVAMPGGVKAGQKTGMTAYVSADNAAPKEVYDDTFLTADSDVALRYIPGSAKISSRGPVNGQVLPDGLLTAGTLLGYDSLNGKLPGCNEFSGYVTFRFTADQPNFTIKKQVSLSGKNDWQDKIVAKLGDQIDYKIAYQNTGTTQQNDIVAKDALPNGVSYVGGTTVLANSVNPSGAKVNDGITTTGLKIGSYAPQGTAFMKFSAKVDGQMAKCGSNELVNTATIITENGNKQSSATVVVDQPCKPNECKPGIPTGDKRCSEECKPGIPVGDARCGKCVPQNGQTVDKDGNCVAAPTSLPKTGPGQVVAGIIAIMAMAAGIVYFYKSRQDLKKAMATGGTITAQTKAADPAEDAPKLLKARTDTNPADDKKEL
jgi:uncharacterized repeat protein (TIGR01451 family)